MAIVSSVKNERFEMNYCCFGEGKKVFVILPGLSLKPLVSGAQAIETGFEIFKKDFTVYLFDRKSNPTNGYTLQQMASDTYEAMRQLGIEKANIFGASQGGMMAQCIAIDHPEFVERLVLGSTLSRVNDLAKETIGRWISLAKDHKLDELNNDFALKVYCKETLEAFEEAILAGNSDVTNQQLDDFVCYALATEGFDCYDKLEKISCPVLVLGAKEDKVVGGESSLEIANKLGCKCYMYEKYGHGVYDEASDYRTRILEFLEK